MYNVESFCEAMLWNEALFGQSREEMEILEQELGVSLHAELNHTLLCLTGVPSGKGAGGFSFRQPSCREELHRLVESLLNEGEKQGISARYAGIHYDRSGQICFFLRCNGAEASAVEAFARKITLRLEQAYQKMEGYAESGLANFTVLSEPISDYEQLAGTFSELCRLKKLSFFRMEPTVFTPMTLKPVLTEVSELYELTEHIGELLRKSEPKELDAAVHRLFSECLKKNLDFEGCGTALYELNRMAYKWQEILPPTEDGEEWKRLSAEEHLTVESLERAAAQALRELQQRIVRSGGKRRNPLTAKTVKWLTEQYHRPVGLQEAAEHFGVTPSYLSRTFSRDMGTPFYEYLSELRLEHAKSLLARDDRKIAWVAEQSGFGDPDYFATFFRKRTGLYPQKYRELHRKTEPDE